MSDDGPATDAYRDYWESKYGGTKENPVTPGTWYEQYGIDPSTPFYDPTKDPYDPRFQPSPFAVALAYLRTTEGFAMCLSGFLGTSAYYLFRHPDVMQTLIRAVGDVVPDTAQFQSDVL